MSATLSSPLTVVASMSPAPCCTSTLPLMLDSAGYLVAAGPYSGPTGPAWLSVRSAPDPNRRSQ